MKSDKKNRNGNYVRESLRCQTSFKYSVAVVEISCPALVDSIDNTLVAGTISVCVGMTQIKRIPFSMGLSNDNSAIGGL